MGAGPIIIGDDGGPPFLFAGRAARDPKSHVKIGRMNEMMYELSQPHGIHKIGNATTIAGIAIVYGDTIDPCCGSKVDIYGDQGCDVTIQINAGGVLVSTTCGLVPETVSGFGGRYVELDNFIARVDVDGRTVYTSDGTGDAARVLVKVI